VIGVVSRLCPRSIWHLTSLSALIWVDNMQLGRKMAGGHGCPRSVPVQLNRGHITELFQCTPQPYNAFHDQYGS
jgi:hypothetical protein